MNVLLKQLLTLPLKLVLTIVGAVVFLLSIVVMAAESVISPVFSRKAPKEASKDTVLSADPAK